MTRAAMWYLKIQRRMYGRWKMMNFFYYLRNKKKKTKCHKEQKNLFFLYFIYLYMKMKWWRNKKTSQGDNNTEFTNFKLQDPYENLNLTNHICECSSKMIISFPKVPCFSVLNWVWIVRQENQSSLLLYFLSLFSSFSSFLSFFPLFLCFSQSD